MKTSLLRIKALPFNSRESSVLHLHDPIGKFEDAAVMGDDHDAALVGENVLPHEAHDVATGLAVERGGRFVKNQNLRTADDRAGDGDTLLLAAAELDGRQLRAALEADDLQIRRRLLQCLIPLAPSAESAEWQRFLRS